MTPNRAVERANIFGNWRRPMLAIAAGCGVALLGVGSASAASGEELFAKYCALCHGKDGKAQNPAARKLGVKDLSVSKATDAEIEKQIIEGRKDERGSLKMPAFKDKLTPEEIKALVTVAKSFRN